MYNSVIFEQTTSESYDNKVRKTKVFQKKKFLKTEIDIHWDNSHNSECNSYKLDFLLLLTKV